MAGAAETVAVLATRAASKKIVLVVVTVAMLAPPVGIDRAVFGTFAKPTVRWFILAVVGLVVRVKRVWCYCDANERVQMTRACGLSADFEVVVDVDSRRGWL